MVFPDQNDDGHLNITYEASQVVFLDHGDGGIVNITFPFDRLFNVLFRTRLGGFPNNNDGGR